MNQRQRILIFALALAVVAAVFVLLALRRGAKGALSAVPADAYLVATLDVPSLRESPVLKPIEEELGGPLALGSLKITCGFDPVERLTEIAVASPEEQSKDFGVAASGAFSREELVGCAEKVMQARGGAATKTPRGDFTVLEDAEPGASRVAAKLAVKDGLALVARGAWLDAMLEAANGAPSAAGNPRHAALRETLAARIPHGAPPTLILTVLLPKALRDRLKTQMVDEAPGGNAAMAGVLAVETAGLEIPLGKTETEVALELRCETEGACNEVKTLILKERKRLLGMFELAFSGVRPLVDSIKLDVSGAQLSGSARGETKGVGRGIRAPHAEDWERNGNARASAPGLHRDAAGGERRRGDRPLKARPASTDWHPSYKFPSVSLPGPEGEWEWPAQTSSRSTTVTSRAKSSSPRSPSSSISARCGAAPAKCSRPSSRSSRTRLRARSRSASSTSTTPRGVADEVRHPQRPDDRRVQERQGVGPSRRRDEQGHADEARRRG